MNTNASKLHPWCQQKDAVKYCQDNNIVVEAYCPLVRTRKPRTQHCRASQRSMA